VDVIGLLLCARAGAASAPSSAAARRVRVAFDMVSALSACLGRGTRGSPGGVPRGRANTWRMRTRAIRRRNPHGPMNRTHRCGGRTRLGLPVRGAGPGAPRGRTACPRALRPVRALLGVRSRTPQPLPARAGLRPARRGAVPPALTGRDHRMRAEKGEAVRATTPREERVMQTSLHARSRRSVCELLERIVATILLSPVGHPVLLPGNVARDPGAALDRARARAGAAGAAVQGRRRRAAGRVNRALGGVPRRRRATPSPRRASSNGRFHEVEGAPSASPFGRGASSTPHPHPCCAPREGTDGHTQPWPTASPRPPTS
jgi:hypothetical protein